MSRKVKHAFATPLAFQKVFMAVENNNAFNILLRVFGEASKFRGHPSQIAKHPANNCFPLGIIPFGESDSQIDLRRFPQPWEQRIEESHRAHGKTPRCGPWEQPQPLEDKPHPRVFEPLLHRLTKWGEKVIARQYARGLPLEESISMLDSTFREEANQVPVREFSDHH